MATKRQQQAVIKLTESDGNKYQALREAGYSHEMAHTPKKVLESKGVQELIEAGLAEGITDEFTVKRLKSAMESDQHVINALRLWFQTKYPQTKEQPGTNIQNNYIFNWGSDAKDETNTDNSAV